jgi:hypothetical protein
MLPESLKNLSKAFQITDRGIFPFLFVNNPLIKLDYSGQIPNFSNFIAISNEEYLEYCKNYNNNSWNLKHEAIKYCNLDCTNLY